MEIKEIIANLKDKYGDKINVEKVTAMLKGHDTGKLSMTDVMAKLKDGGLLGDLDGDGKVESALDEVKGKLGSLFGKH